MPNPFGSIIDRSRDALQMGRPPSRIRLERGDRVVWDGKGWTVDAIERHGMRWMVVLVGEEDPRRGGAPCVFVEFVRLERSLIEPLPFFGPVGEA